jgi:hypothetical protein
MDWFPVEPDVPASQRAVAESTLRYEDVSQDGRLMVLALPHTIGDVIWRKLLMHHPAASAPQKGIVPILTRFVIEGGAGPVSVRRPLDASGAYQFSHTVDASGAVDRILINMWTSLTAPAARTNGPPPPNAGEPLAVGRVFAEHVMTRLFAPPAERKVLSLDVDGESRVPHARWTWRPLDAVLEPPAGATWLDDAFTPDAADVVFGLHHTDSNQHVNSLQYPRLFQDAALRRFAQLGRDARVLTRRIEIAYRKPCFAGERIQIVMRAFAAGSDLGAVGAFVSASAPLERPHCVVQARFGA